jgi:hypothetical protein
MEACVSKQEKLLKRIAEVPSDLRWSELVSLMKALGYTLEKGAGSRRKFMHKRTGARFNMHEPHPTGILKAYQVRDLVEFLILENHL